jgi:two-component system response regulator HydG
LRVLEEREITRVGDNRPVKVNVRVLSATNRDLEEAIEKGTFRNDLYFRLKIVTVDLPPLRERRDDILPLVDYFRRTFAKRHHKAIKGVSAPVSRRLFDYKWKGNVRELRNVVENMVVLDIDGLLDMDDLPPDLTESPGAITTAAAAGAAGSGDGPPALLGQSMAAIERWAIEETLKLTGGNREEASNILQIGERTLYRKLKEYGH